MIGMLDQHAYSKPVSHFASLFNKLDSIARDTQLIMRKSRHFSAESFLLALMKAVITGQASFNQMASVLGKCEIEPASKQALWKRIGNQSVAFMIRVLHLAMEEKWETQKIIGDSPFKRILCGDSSQEKMHASNHKNFAGHGNKQGKTSGCKVDLCFDLLTGEPVHQILHEATTQDKVLGQQLVDMVRPGDLVLRDMGYFATSEFALIAEREAYWLSRLPVNVEVTTEQSKSLEEVLKKHRGNTLDITAFLGQEAHHRARLVAIRASDEVANSRRRQRREAAAKKGKTPSANALLRDGWHIMVCNITEEQLSTEKLTALYSVRWQIEITFRAWKQSGNLQKTLNRKSSKHHLETLLYASILHLIMTMKIASYLQIGLHKTKRIVSIEKVADDLGLYLTTITRIEDYMNYSPHIPHIIMESRKREPLIAKGLRCLS